MAQVALVRTEEDPQSVADAVDRAVDLIGGMGRFITSGMRVLVKPNLVAPVQTAVTDYGILRTIIRRLQDLGAKPVLGECPGFEFDSEATLRFLKARELAMECGVEFINFEYGEFVEVDYDHPFVPRVRVAKAAIEADAIVNVPRMKSHKLTTLSLGIKNCFGMLEKSSRRKIHAMGLDRGIAALYKLFKPAFTLIDGLSVPVAGAVYGQNLPYGIIAASEDMLSLDLVCTHLLGADPIDVFHVAIAWGDWTLTPEVVGDRMEPIEVFGIKDTARRRLYRAVYRSIYALDHQLSRVSKKSVIPWFHRTLGVKPVINWSQCNYCGECVRVCPVDAIDLAKSHLDYGQCGKLRCLKCVGVCEPAAISVKQAFKVK